ncbi:hypothetical protein [Burkholderia territorii]|uniref:hypothetical protein n=1 Tax=Burkholderia territorii TaxID=1503055 RepID=UPI000B2EB22B|nr:hypothetical protein [Burkholderia territorii]
MQLTARLRCDSDHGEWVDTPQCALPNRIVHRSPLDIDIDIDIDIDAHACTRAP